MCSKQYINLVATWMDRPKMSIISWFPLRPRRFAWVGCISNSFTIKFQFVSKKINNISMITILRGNHYERPHKYTTMANSLTPIPTQCHLLYRSLPIGETKSTTSLQVNSCTLTKFMQQIARWTLKLKVDCKAHFLLKSKWVSIRYGFLHDILTLPTYCVVGNLIT